MMELAERVACELAKRFEGLLLSPYLCPAGVPTIGYGATFYPNGRAVTLKDPPISKEVAERLLLLEVRRLLPLVLQACRGIDNEKRLGAIVDFTFNLGLGRLRSSTMRRRINAGAWDQVPTELRKWVMGGGKPLKGLVRRREAEITYV